MAYAGKKSSDINHDDFIRMWNAGVPVEEIAKKFGVPKTLVLRYAKKHIDECSQKTMINHNDFVRLWNSENSLEEIAQKLGVKTYVVEKYARKHRDSCPSKRKGFEKV